MEEFGKSMRTTVLRDKDTSVQFDDRRAAELGAELNQFASAKGQQALLVIAGRNTEENLGYPPEQMVTLEALLNEGGGAEEITSENGSAYNVAKLKSMLDAGGVPLGFLVEDYQDLDPDSPNDYEVVAEFANERIPIGSGSSLSFADAFCTFVLENVGNAELGWMAFPEPEGIQ